VPGSLPRATAGNADRSAETEGDALEAVPLRQRALPFLELLRGALASGEPVTWGVV
jgi:hypothetical protein